MSNLPFKGTSIHSQILYSTSETAIWTSEKGIWTSEAQKHIKYLFCVFLLIKSLPQLKNVINGLVFETNTTYRINGS